MTAGSAIGGSRCATRVDWTPAPIRLPPGLAPGRVRIHMYPMMSGPGHERSRVVGASTWLASFAIATMLGLGVALQRWYAYRGPNKPPAFWDANYIQPQLIPWYAWALIAPLLMLLVHRLPWGALRV